MSEWISVQEKLPEDNLGRYLVCAIEHGFEIVDFMRFSKIDGWIYDGKPTAAKVTHWMPLPEPPMEQESKRCVIIQNW